MRAHHHEAWSVVACVIAQLGAGGTVTQGRSPPQPMVDPLGKVCFQKFEVVFADAGGEYQGGGCRG